MSTSPGPGHCNAKGHPPTCTCGFGGTGPSAEASVEDLGLTPAGSADLAAENAALTAAHAANEARLDAEHAEQQTGEDPDDFWGEPIHVYTRAQAIADGVLHDYSKMGREAGFAWPVAVTSAAHADAIEWTDSNAGLQDTEGRAWDVMWMANHAVRSLARREHGQVGPGTRVPFQVMRVPNTPRATVPRATTLHVIVSADDDGKPCLTIALPDED